MMAMNGLDGGIEKLLDRCKKPMIGPWNMEAMDMGVLHVGGERGFDQFKPKAFLEPIIKTAVGAGANGLAYVVTEGLQSKNPDHGCFGDAEKVQKYLAKFTSESKQYGVFYKLFDLSNPKNTKIPVKLYLDFDFKVKKGTPWVECWEKVAKAIEIVNNAILDNVMVQGEEAVGFDCAYNVCFGERELSVGMAKFSFHVVWEHQGCVNNKQQQNFLAGCLGGKNTEYDTKVYGTHQLMRTPWCGKGKNVNAVLLPTTFAREEGKWCKTTVSGEFDVALFEKFDINVKNKAATLLHTCELNSKTGNVSVTGAQKAVKAPQSVETKKFREFFDPLLLDYLLPLIQRHRAQLCRGVKDDGIVTQAGVVVENFTTSLMENGNHTGQVKVRVIGDTFCEHDTGGSSPHFHHGTQGTLLIDFNKGWYQQLCYRCGGAFKNKYSIFGTDCLQVEGLVHSNFSPKFLKINKKQGMELMLRFFQRILVLNKKKGSSLVVYNEKARIWVVDDSESQTLMTKKNIFVRKYKAYLEAWNRMNYNEAVVNGVKEKKAHVALDRADDKVGGLEPLPSEEGPLVKALQGAWEMTFGFYSKVKFNPRKDLVPMNDGNCYEVRTGRVIQRTKDMYFTSQLNACMKHDTLDAECTEIRNWFMEVACERRSLAEYMRRVVGLLMTGMEFDRKFYVNLGKGSNGKSLNLQMLEVTQNNGCGLCEDVFRSV